MIPPYAPAVELPPLPGNLHPSIVPYAALGLIWGRRREGVEIVPGVGELKFGRLVMIGPADSGVKDNEFL